jgi:GGDEF domain-containing protein
MRQAAGPSHAATAGTSGSAGSGDDGRSHRPRGEVVAMASCCPEIPRARFRVLFFALLASVCALAGYRLPLAVATCCFGIGILSALVAHSRGRRLALTFVTVDWLGLGLMCAASGGSHSPLLYAVPALLALHLAPTPPPEWLHVAAPLAAGVAMLLVTDPTLGGSRFLGFLRLTGLLLVGLIPVLFLNRWRSTRIQERTRHGRATGGAVRSSRRPAGAAVLAGAVAQRPAHGKARPVVDPTTGFDGLPRVADLLTAMMADATESHQAVGVICVRLLRWSDIRGFHGDLSAEAAAAQAARRLRRHLRPGDHAFRVRSDTFVLACRHQTYSRARELAAELSAELDGQRLERSGERLTAACGVSSFPATRSLESLLREAAAGAEAGDRLGAASAR